MITATPKAGHGGGIFSIAPSTPAEVHDLGNVRVGAAIHVGSWVWEFLKYLPDALHHLAGSGI